MKLPIVNLWQPPQSPGVYFPTTPSTSESPVVSPSGPGSAPVTGPATRTHPHAVGDNQPIIDGFMYNPLLRYTAMRFLPLAYERLKKFRTGNWQPRFYTVPVGNGGAVVTAGATLSQQIRTAVSGCELIGYTLGTLTESPEDFGVVIVDADAEVPCSGDTGYPFSNGIDRYIVGGAYAAATYTGSSGASGQRFVLLTEPYPILGDRLTVKLSNLTTATDIQVQLALYIMEPFNAA
jgi:hypothetical protein